MVKNCYKRLESTSGEVFLDSFPSEACKVCVDSVSLDCTKVICPIDGIPRWRGFRKTAHGCAIICADYGKSKGLIEDFDSITGSLKTLCSSRDEALRFKEEDSVKRIRRVLHNVRTINAHALMEMRGIVPDSMSERNVKGAITSLSGYIVNNADQTAHGLLEIAKDLYGIKTEFSVYDKLIKGGEALSMQSFNIRNVLMTVVYPFFGDFTQKNIYVDIHPYRDTVRFDFETIQIAFYHIVENMSKYVKPNTKVVISFPVVDGYQKVVFEMISLYIGKDEIDKIFSEGYSGNQAKQSGQSGEGIGLYRARRLVEMNGGTLVVEAGDNKQSYKDTVYSNNRFIISLPIG